MARPKTKELTERELEVMHVFWNHGEQTIAEVRERLENEGRDLAYTTVATLVKILLEKAFLSQTNEERPFKYLPIRTFEEVSGNLLGDLLSRVFGGSREQLLVRLMDQSKLTAKERKLLEEVLNENKHK
jgi:predicted transcriptional regulator